MKKYLLLPIITATLITGCTSTSTDQSKLKALTPAQYAKIPLVIPMELWRGDSSWVNENFKDTALDSSRTDIWTEEAWERIEQDHKR